MVRKTAKKGDWLLCLYMAYSFVSVRTMYLPLFGKLWPLRHKNPNNQLIHFYRTSGSSEVVKHEARDESVLTTRSLEHLPEHSYLSFRWGSAICLVRAGGGYFTVVFDNLSLTTVKSPRAIPDWCLFLIHDGSQPRYPQLVVQIRDISQKRLLSVMQYYQD